MQIIGLRDDDFRLRRNRTQSPDHTSVVIDCALEEFTMAE